MIKGRNVSFLNKNKSKLVITRSNNYPEDRENHTDKHNLLDIKPIAVNRKDSLGPIRIRPTSNSKNQKSQSKHKITVSLPASNKKIRYSEQQNRQLILMKQEENREVHVCGLQSGFKLEHILDELLCSMEQDQSGPSQSEQHKLLLTCCRQLVQLITQNHYQLHSKLFNKIQKVFDSLQQRIHHQPIRVQQSFPKAQRAFAISREISIVEHLLMESSKVEEKTKWSSHLEMSSSFQNEKQSKNEMLWRDSKEGVQNNGFVFREEQNQKLSISRLNFHQKVRLGLDETFNSRNPAIPPAQLELFKKEHLELMTSYVKNQPNKIVQSASILHQQIEEEMFLYADFIRTSRYGTSTYITDVNVNALDALVAKDLKQTNKRIIQSQEELVVKCRAMRDFVTRIREKYDSLIKEMMIVIDKKTELCRQFAGKVSKWYENYLARSEYLANLKEQYCQQLYLLYAELKKVPQKLMECREEQVLATVNCMKGRVDKIDRIVLIGNTFY